MARPHIFLLLFLLALGGGLYLWTHPPYKPAYEVECPARLIDDFGRTSLIAALKSQRAFLKRQPQSLTVTIGTREFTNGWLLDSVETLLEFLTTQPTDEKLDSFVRDNYQFFQAGGRKHKWFRKMLVTGYYEPQFRGSLTPKLPRATPLYTPPPFLVKRNLKEANEIGRYDDQGNFTTFWTREEIETQHQLDGFELVYLKDPFDAYLLHIQGSGKIELDDGTVRAVRFAGSNGLAYKSIGKYLVDQKIMERKDVSIPAIRKYITDHPDQLLPLLYQNPRYIFFSWADNGGPRGSSGEVLTPGRSIAIDPSALPTGTIAYLQTEKPVLNDKGDISEWVPMERFVFPQDSGSAIEGTGRVDVFWGSGNYAETAANHMKQDGRLFFLIKKGFAR